MPKCIALGCQRPGLDSVTFSMGETPVAGTVVGSGNRLDGGLRDRPLESDLKSAGGPLPCGLDGVKRKQPNSRN
ncbi:MAG: hypothetical protein ABSG03_21595 [Bryobacteraceae bacterium]|jgi:hypothetical protein